MLPSGYWFSIIVIGLLAGGVTAMTGASGVVIVVPLTTLLLHLPMYKAIGTSLLVDAISCLAISYSYNRNGRVDIRSGIWVALGCIAGAQIGAALVTGISSPKLGVSFGIVLIIMGIIMWKKGINKSSTASPKNRLLKVKPWQRTAIVLGIGLVLGIQAGILGIGGGVLIFLILVFILNYPLHIAIGTSTFIMSLSALSGAIGYACRGNVDFVFGIGIGLSAVLGGIISARFANRFNERTLAKTIGSVFISIGICLILLRTLQICSRKIESTVSAGELHDVYSDSETLRK